MKRTRAESCSNGLRAGRGDLRSQRGFSLVELLVAMSLATVITFAALALVQSASSNVAHTTEQSEVQQRARIALESIVTTLHGGCVAPAVTPAQIAPFTTTVSGRNVSFGPDLVRFVAAHSNSPVAEPELVEFEYVEDTGSLGREGPVGSLVERVHGSPVGSPPNWLFESGTTRDRTLLKNVLPAVGANGSPIPIFQYFRYYDQSELEAPGSTAQRGVLDPTPMTQRELEEEAAKEEALVQKGEGRGNEISKILITFTTEPTGSLATYRKDLPLPVSDAVVFRVNPTSTTSGAIDLPCT